MIFKSGQVRIIYDGEARIHLNDLVHFDAEIYNISSGGMLIGITSNKAGALGDQIFLSGTSMLVEFSLPSSEGRLLSEDVKLSRIHSHQLNRVDDMDHLQLGVFFQIESS